MYWWHTSSCTKNWWTPHTWKFWSYSRYFRSPRTPKYAKSGGKIRHFCNFLTSALAINFGAYSRYLYAWRKWYPSHNWNVQLYSRYFQCPKIQKFTKPGGKIRHLCNYLASVLHPTLVLTPGMLTHEDGSIQPIIEIFIYIQGASGLLEPPPQKKKKLGGKIPHFCNILAGRWSKSHFSYNGWFWGW